MLWKVLKVVLVIVIGMAILDEAVATFQDWSTRLIDALSSIALPAGALSVAVGLGAHFIPTHRHHGVPMIEAGFIGAGGLLLLKPLYHVVQGHYQVWEAALLSAMHLS